LPGTPGFRERASRRRCPVSVFPPSIRFSRWLEPWESGFMPKRRVVEGGFVARAIV